MSGEVFHLQVKGEQRGPYTLRQIDHMLHAGLIPAESLFIREGMEEWHPITDLVVLRVPVKRWKRRAILAGIALFLVLIGRFFGPTVLDGWRETSQKEFTEKAAYWSARDAIRQHALPRGALVRFEKFAHGQVTLEPEPAAAKVVLHAEIIGPDGKFQPASWDVALTYQARLKQWTSGEVSRRP